MYLGATHTNTNTHTHTHTHTHTNTFLKLKKLFSPPKNSTSLLINLDEGRLEL